MTNIIIAIIVLHLLGGFGWLLWKLSPRKGDRPLDEDQDELPQA